MMMHIDFYWLRRGFSMGAQRPLHNDETTSFCSKRASVAQPLFHAKEEGAPSLSFTVSGSLFSQSRSSLPFLTTISTGAPASTRCFFIFRNYLYGVVFLAHPQYCFMVSALVVCTSDRLGSIVSLSGILAAGFFEQRYAILGTHI